MQKDGTLNLDHLHSLIDEQTKAVVIHHINSETGLIQDLTAVGNMILKCNKKTLFIADTIQSAGKIMIPWQEAKLDFVLISGHKTGAPGGAAAVFTEKKVSADFKFNNYFKNLRTVEHLKSRPVPAIVFALVKSVETLYEMMQENYGKAVELNNLIRKRVNELKLFNNKKIIFPAKKDLATPYIINFIMPGIQSAVIVRMLSEKILLFHRAVLVLLKVESLVKF